MIHSLPVKDKNFYLMNNVKGTVFQPRVLQLNLDNMNRLTHSKYPNRKIGGMCRCGTRTRDLLCARQTPKPLGNQLPWVYCSVTDVLMDISWPVMGNIANTTIHLTWTLEQEINYLMLNCVPTR